MAFVIKTDTDKYYAKICTGSKFVVNLKRNTPTYYDNQDTALSELSVIKSINDCVLNQTNCSEDFVDLDKVQVIETR
ncbi:hypothetical protein JOC36_001495 [Weissella uvarum]|nr:hypothetical protein [Weissella uvarum]